jgi:uncharacterized membrane protein YhaH (DUF805 family)
MSVIVLIKNIKQKVCIILKKVFYNTPRIGRIKYLGILSFFMSAMILADKSVEFFSEKLEIYPFLFIVVAVFWFIYILVAKIRRLHDFDFNGWWVLLNIVPGVGLLWWLAIIVFPGSKDNNDYGTMPEKPSILNYALILMLPALLIIFHMMDIKLDAN